MTATKQKPTATITASADGLPSMLAYLTRISKTPTMDGAGKNSPGRFATR